MPPWILWLTFHLFLLCALILDLGILQRGSRLISFSNALFWSGIWVLLAFVFGLGLYYFRGPDTGLSFFAGYLLEWALSVDNLFAFLSVFTFLSVPQAFQHRVLLWGILGALVMRASFIFLGIALLERFHWILYVCGLFLLGMGVRMIVSRVTVKHASENGWIRGLTGLLPLTSELHGGRFWIYEVGKYKATPLLLALLMIEVMDLLFAMDSVPAVLGITRDPFVVYTSNIFAILGLRSLYFVLSGMMSAFHFLRFGLAGVLIFIGGKLCLSPFFSISTWDSLLVIAGCLTLSIVASIWWPAVGEASTVRQDLDI